MAGIVTQFVGECDALQTAGDAWERRPAEKKKAAWYPNHAA